MRVLFIDDDFTHSDEQIDATLKYFKEIPMSGKEYSVRAYINYGNTVGLLLEGINNDINEDGIEPNFSVDRVKILEL